MSPLARNTAVLFLVAAGIAFAAAPLAAVALSSVRARTFENEDLLVYAAQAGDLFGFALATGDFNGDGADDLATGIPFDDGLSGSPIVDMGAVVVRYGIPGKGLDAGPADSFLSQLQAGSPGNPNTLEMFGRSLAAGDFNGDGIDDLAVFRDGTWIIDTNGNGTMDADDEVIQLGEAGDTPVVGDWDGDGRPDLGVYHDGDIVKSTARK